MRLSRLNSLLRIRIAVRRKVASDAEKAARAAEIERRSGIGEGKRGHGGGEGKGGTV